MDEYLQLLYDSYKRQRLTLHEAALEAGARYDRSVLTLGGGALALSITFIEKITPFPVPWTIFILIFAWLALLLSVILQLLALAESQKAIQLQIQRLDAEYGFYRSSDDLNSATTNFRVETENRHSSKVARFNKISRACLITGIILLFVFSGANMNRKEPTMGENPDSNPKQQPQHEQIHINHEIRIPNSADKILGTYIPPSNELPPPPPRPIPTPPVNRNQAANDSEAG